MGDNSSIEWCEATWNPTVGCSKVSAGCDICYAATQAPRQAGKGLYEGVVDADGWTGRVNLAGPQHLDQPLRWARPRRIFVDSMSDLFHPEVPDQYVAEVYARMGLAAHHTFQVLTKRPQRMQQLLNSDRFRRLWFDARAERAAQPDLQGRARRGQLSLAVRWPLPNVWQGVSVEDDSYSWRARYLRETEAAVRFVSAEPLLGGLPRLQLHATGADLGGIDWVIVGGESGHGARPMHPEWARELRDRCQAQGVAFLFKQWGAWGPSDQHHNVRMSRNRMQWRGVRFQPDGTPYDPVGRQHPTEPGGYAGPGMESMLLVGKHKAGRVLDGRTWDQYPEGQA